MAFSVDPPGVLVLARHHDADGVWLTIERADPHVAFSDELLCDLADGGDNDGMYPIVRIDRNYAHNMADCRIDGRCFDGWLVHIEARNRTVIYRIGAYDALRNCWRAAWPD